MKRLILISLILCAAFAGNAQLPAYSGYTNINSGYQWLRGLFAALGAPAGGNAAFATGQAQRAGALYYDSTGVDSGFYYYSGTQWRLIGGSSIDSTLASQGNQMSGDTVVFAGPIGTPGLFTNERAINTNRLIMHWTNGIPAEAGGAIWQFSQRPYSPFQFISQDTVTVSDAFPTYGRPLSGIYARRTVYYNPTIYKTQQSYGHYFGQTYSWLDSVVSRNDGMDYQQAMTVEQRYKPRGSGYQVIRLANGTGNDARLLHATGTLVSNTYYDGVDNASTDTLRTRGYSAGITSYLVAATGSGKLRGTGHVYFLAGSLQNANSYLEKTYVLARQTDERFSDSSYMIWDTLRTSRSVLRNVVVGHGDSLSSGAQFKVYGSSLFTGWSGYWSNVAANYTARSFTDKNYVDSAIAAAGGGGVTTMAAVGASPNANGASITGSTLTLQPASGSFPGVMTAGTQTIGGEKFYTDIPHFQNIINHTYTNVGSTPAAGTGWLFAKTADKKLYWMDDAAVEYDLTAGSSGANTALSNLAAVAINTSLISDANNTDDLGSSANAWKDIYGYTTRLKGSTSGTVTLFSDPLSQVVQATTLDGTGHIPSVYDVYVRADETLANSAADQDLFTNTAHNTFTVLANTTYEFDFKFDLTHGAVAHSLAFGMTPTTATITNIAYNCLTISNIAVGTQTASQTMVRIKATTTTAVNASAANASETVEGKGWFTVGATGGTITPQIKFSVDPTGTVLLKAGAEFHIRAKGNNTYTENGPWN